MAPAPAEAPHQHAPVEHPRDGHELKREVPPLLSKLSFAALVYGVQSLSAPIVSYLHWKDYFYPPEGGPDLKKKYQARPYLPVRIFFPGSFDRTSQQTFPTLFTLHGGGFCFGDSRELDGWNRTFADKFNVLVVSLGYSKAPSSPFPAAIYDIEALVLAVLEDESLPIDRSPRAGRHGLSRTAILGFSAGGNLAMAVSQLESIRTHELRPAAAVSVYGCVDMSVPPHEKLRNRPFKPKLGPARGAVTDLLMNFCPTFDWSYIPYGHDLRDPLLSPIYAPRASLPPFVGFVAAELDFIAHEGWRMACRLGHDGVEAQGGQFAGQGRSIPDREGRTLSERICGKVAPSPHEGKLRGLGGDGKGAEDERFAFEDNWNGGGVKWLLVPDVLHGFDHRQFREAYARGDKATVHDAELKTVLYMEELGRWLSEKVWGL